MPAYSRGEKPINYLQDGDDRFTAFSPEDYVVPADTRGFIYMVHDYTDPDYIKIGRTADLQKRLTSYNSNRPRNSVQLIAVTEMFEDSVEVEKRIFASINTFFEAIPSKGTKEWYAAEYKDNFLDAMRQAEEFFQLADLT